MSVQHTGGGGCAVQRLMFSIPGDIMSTVGGGGVDIMSTLGAMSTPGRYHDKCG